MESATLAIDSNSKWSHYYIMYTQFTEPNGTTLWTEKHTNVFFWYSLQNPTDCDKIWYILSWVILSYRNVNVFCLTWIVSLIYLVKLSICILQVNSSYNCEPKNTPKCFCYIFYETGSIFIRFGTYFPDYICHSVMSKSNGCIFSISKIKVSK